MDRIVFKESNKSYLIIDFILYIVVAVIGLVIFFTNCLSLDTLYSFYWVFYVVAILSLIAYCLNRRKNDYETLIFSLINVFVGSFALLNYNYFNDRVILSVCMFMYTICNIANKWYYSYILNEKQDAFVIAKSSITFLLGILGVIISFGFYSNIFTNNEMIGYYFAIFGLISLLEPFMKVLIRKASILGYDIEENKTLKDSTKISVKEKVKPEVKKRNSTIRKNNVKEK